MEEIGQFFAAFPAWAGSVPMWGIFCMVAIAFIKVWPTLRQQSIDERLNIRDKYMERITELKTEVADCRKECDEQERRLQLRIEDLQTRLNNEAWQRIQGEISLVRTLTQIVDAPQLTIILEALERRGATMPHAVEVLSGPLDDARDNGDG